jgi:hypothetical protein
MGDILGPSDLVFNSDLPFNKTFLYKLMRSQLSITIFEKLSNISKIATSLYEFSHSLMLVEANKHLHLNANPYIACSHYRCPRKIELLCSCSFLIRFGNLGSVGAGTRLFSVAIEVKEMRPIRVRG